MAKPIAVTFTDGTTRTVHRRPVHEVRQERITKAEDGPTFILMAQLWAADTGGTDGRAAFEKWLEDVESWEVEEAAEAEADPPDQGHGTSPD